MPAKKFDPVATLNCIKCGFVIPTTAQDGTIIFVTDIEHNIVPPHTIQDLNTWQGRDNCIIKGDSNVTGKTDHLLVFCPRCRFIDEYLTIDAP